MKEIEISFWAKELEEAMKERTRVMNRVRQFGITPQSYVKAVKDREKLAKKNLKENLKRTKYISLTNIPGVGETTVGNLVRYTRDNKRIVKNGKYVGTQMSTNPKPYPGARSLVHHAGFHNDPETGRAAKRKRGEQIDFNQRFKSSMLRWSNSVWKLRKGPYWKIMKKAYEKSLKNPNHSDWTDPHHKAHARRIGIKELLKDFYGNYL